MGDLICRSMTLLSSVIPVDYSRYPEVHMTKSTGMGELRKIMDHTMRTNGVPDEIWTDGGPPYNSHEWREWAEDWGSKPKRTTPYHPLANGMVERFNQVLKQTILMAYADKKDPLEEVDKLVASYRNTPHSVTGEKPYKLMHNRDIRTKLPSFRSVSRGKHHREAREKDREAKLQMKERYDAKNRTKQVEINLGDWAYIKRTATSSTKGTWDPIPYQITHIYENQITGRRHDDEKTRDRSDWKLLASRPPHLQAFNQIERRVSAPPHIQQPPTGWNVVDDDDSWGNDDDDNRPNTRAQKARRAVW